MSGGGLPCPVLLVGCGRMGGALLSGWLDMGLSAGDVRIVEPEPGPALAALAGGGLSVVDDPTSLLAASFAPRAVLFAVKPQAMADIVPAYAAFADAGAVFLSIAAGTRIRAIEGWLGRPAAVVRAMPNTPAAIRRGITVCCAGAGVDDAGRALSDRLLSAVGEVAWVGEESLLDPVTAVSGSGPAYVFLLIECLAEAGVAAGLEPALAARLARATVAGAGELARGSDLSAAELRRNVTSPGGTTEAALAILMAEEGLGALMTRAVAAAAKRAAELGG